MYNSLHMDIFVTAYFYNSCDPDGDLANQGPLCMQAVTRQLIGWRLKRQ